MSSSASGAASPEDVVRRFLELCAQGRASEATELLDTDVVWRNSGWPAIRGRRVGSMLRDMDRRGIGFEAVLHHVAATVEGDVGVVLTERTDILRWGRWSAAFWVCGTFEVADGRITLWDDHFSNAKVLLAGLRGLLGLARSGQGSR